MLSRGKLHDQGDAKWIVIRGQLRGHNDTPYGHIWWFSYHQLVIFFFNIVT